MLRARADVFRACRQDDAPQSATLPIDLGEGVADVELTLSRVAQVHQDYQGLLAGGNTTAAAALEEQGRQLEQLAVQQKEQVRLANTQHQPQGTPAEPNPDTQGVMGAQPMEDIGATGGLQQRPVVQQAVPAVATPAPATGRWASRNAVPLGNETQSPATESGTASAGTPAAPTKSGNDIVAALEAKGLV